MPKERDRVMDVLVVLIALALLGVAATTGQACYESGKPFDHVIVGVNQGGAIPGVGHTHFNPLWFVFGFASFCSFTSAFFLIAFYFDIMLPKSLTSFAKEWEGRATNHK